MRQFNKDKPEFFCFQLEGSETVYKIPVAASMPVPILKMVGEGFMGQYEMLKHYIGDKIDEIPTGVVSDIIKAWSEESKVSGAAPGESSALSD